MPTSVLSPSTSAHAVWLGEQFTGMSRVGLPWLSLLGFLLRATNPRVVQRPESTADAWAQVVAWLDAEVVWIPHPTECHRAVLESLVAAPGMQANWFLMRTSPRWRQARLDAVLHRWQFRGFRPPRWQNSLVA